ncbi:MAG: HD domain-containing protein [Bacteroidota bacterium]|nr:HD domain-containing protein [Bacteroidota bacterium]
MNKKKIFNDPVYGFVTIPTELVFDIIEHPYFQRLRRIKQLGLTDMVYPGALHTRFHHAIGALHLMQLTLDNLRAKGHHIDKNEYEATLIAILLHDIGHGPFSHALENSLLPDLPHEKLSYLIMGQLNKVFHGALSLCMKIFDNSYERKFFHQLVSSQLDIDRLDYLKRDSFFTGVSEGTIGANRIIKMLDIKDDQVVVEEKGIYSVENFLSARRLMYWQVYLHKTTVSCEKMLIQVIRRAKFLAQKGINVFASQNLKIFLEKEIYFKDFNEQEVLLKAFCNLDDFDIWASIKTWALHEDKILSSLSNMILERKLFKIKLSNTKPLQSELQSLKKQVMDSYQLNKNEINFFFVHGSMSNSAYIAKGQKINILTKSGMVLDIAKASDLPNIKAMSKIVRKYYLCWPKIVSL